MPITRVVLKGTRHYCASAAGRRGDLHAAARLALIAEVGNPYDVNAVVVHLGKTGEKLGYLPKEIALEYRQRIQSGSIIEAKILSADMVPFHNGEHRLRVEISIKYKAPENRTNAPKYGMPPLNDGQLSNGPGVYVIINDIEHRSYIGSSKNISHRIAQHFRDLKSGKHANARLQKDYTNQLGRGFTTAVIQRLQRPEYCEGAENRAILAALRQNQKLYNMTEDGRGSAAGRFGTVIDADTIEAISEREPKPRNRKINRNDGAAPLDLTRGSSSRLLRNLLISTPQHNPDFRWLRIVGVIILLILITQMR